MQSRRSWPTLRGAANQSESSVNREIAEQSRFSYGWVLVIASFILLIGSFGTQLCFTVLLKPLTEEFGWTRAATSGAMSLLIDAGRHGVVAPPVDS
jgi:hypothetical protein